MIKNSAAREWIRNTPYSYDVPEMEDMIRTNAFGNNLSVLLAYVCAFENADSYEIKEAAQYQIAQFLDGYGILLKDHRGSNIFDVIDCIKRVCT